jgi:hypothetical protein
LPRARPNVDKDELATAQDIAKGWLGADAKALALAVAEGLIQEMVYGEKEED